MNKYKVSAINTNLYLNRFLSGNKIPPSPLPPMKNVVGTEKPIKIPDTRKF